MSTRYKLVRLHADTHTALLRMQRQMMLAYKCGHIDLPDEQAEHVSLDFVIKRLQRHFDEHRARRAKRSGSAKNRKGV